ncbi:hypothetical protein [Nevskia sp.]|uniref:hypothetical protein n=1 Tax=Nevskia sp. TaxID=1929292 RepID=UPI0025CC64DE|nr:hypothetical protein [Nevskia sp.]
MPKMTSTMKTLILAALLVPFLSLAQNPPGGNASRIKKKEKPAVEAPEQLPEVTYTPFTPLTPEAEPAAPSCEAPPVIKAFASQIQADQFNDAFSNYQACMKDYVTVHTAAANAHAAVANKAVAEANAYISELNSRLAKDQDKDKK